MSERPRGHPLELRLPPAVVFLLAVGMIAGARHYFAPGVAPAWATALSGGLLLLGAAIAVAALLGFARAGTTVEPREPGRASELVTGGLYRFTRNPMYLGMALVLVAGALRVWHPVAAIAPLFFVLWIDRFQVQPEERALRERFGGAYREYCGRVRRWV